MLLCSLGAWAPPALMSRLWRWAWPRLPQGLLLPLPGCLGDASCRDGGGRPAPDWTEAVPLSFSLGALAGLKEGKGPQ